MKTQAHLIHVSLGKTMTLWAGSLILGAGLLLVPHISLAQDPQDDAAFTCASAVNVMDCIKATGTGGTTPTAASITNVPINSDLLGFTGPLSAGIRYDNYLAWILDVGYVQGFGDGAAALKLSAGLNERRANVSLGYAITPKQQIKLTYEYLAQNLPFDYASGTVNEWVNQNAFGAAYRYIIGHSILKDIEVYGTYTKAGSKELSEVEMYTDNLLTQINYRRIAGGTEMTTGGTVTLTPLKGTILKVGAGYSTLSFDTKWEDPSTTAALVYNAELAHLLTPTTLVSVGIGNTASGRSHTAKVSQILPWSLEAAVIGQYTATTNDIPSSTSVTASLSYPAPKTYENVVTAGLSNIKDWVSKPVVYHSRVLARAEERVVQVQITTNPIPKTVLPVGNTLTPIQTKDYFLYNQEVFDKIDYKILSIVNKSDDKPATANLNLVMTPVDSFNATLSTSAPAPQSAMTPGEYTVTLQAQGYRKGQVVSQVNNPLDLSVTVNNNLAAPTWVADPKLPEVAMGGTYPETPLTPYLVPSSLSGGDSYTFKFDDKTPPPSWIKLSSDSQSLTNNGTAPSPTTSAPFNIIATSKASGKSTPQSFTIVVADSPLVAPTWKADASLPGVITGSNYPSTPLTPLVQNNTGATETYNFELVGSDNPAWVTLSPDTQNLIANGPSPAVGQAIVHLKATSTSSLKSTPVNDFTIAITSNAPSWTADPNNANVTYASGNTSYKFYIIDSQNPNQFVSGTPTLKATNLVISSNFPANSIKDLSEDSRGWYVPIDLSNSGDINKQAKFSVDVYTLDSADHRSPSSTGNFVVTMNPNAQAQPTWTGELLPNIGAGENYPNTDLSQYVQDSSGLPVQGTYTFKVYNNDIPSWLKLSEDSKYLTYNTAAPVTPGTATISLIGTNSLDQSTTHKQFTITIVPGNAPKWNDNLVLTLPYYSVANITTGTQATCTTQGSCSVSLFTKDDSSKSYVSPVSGESTVNLTSLTQGVSLNHTGDNWDTAISTTNIESVNASSYFTISAASPNNANITSPGNFTVKIVSNPNGLTEPAQTTYPLPKADYNQSTNYSVVIDPYKDSGSADQYQLTKTVLKGTTTTVADKLSFTPKAGESNCIWGEISDGVFKQNAPIVGGDCNISYTVRSTATGKDVNYIKTIVVGNPPQWGSNLNQNIKFDAYDVSKASKTYAIYLNDLLTQGNNAPGLKFAFQAGVDTAKWKIYENPTTDPNKPKDFYLMRVGADAKDIGTTYDIGVIATNDKDPGGVSTVLKVTVKNDSDLYVVWAPQFTIPVTIGSGNISMPINQRDILTCIDQACTTVVTGDTITIPDQTVVTFPSGKTAAMSSGNVVIASDSLVNSDAGKYAFTLQNVASVAKGSAVTLDGSGDKASLILTANLAFDTTKLNQHIVYSDTTTGINLSDLLKYGNIEGVTIAFNGSVTNYWKIISNKPGSGPTVYTLVRNSYQNADGRKHLYANDMSNIVYGPVVPVNLPLKASYNTVSAIGTLAATVDPDLTGTYVPRWDPQTPNVTLYPDQTWTKTTITGTYNQNNYIKTCNAGANEYQCGNTIVEGDEIFISSVSSPQGIRIFNTSGYTPANANNPNQFPSGNSAAFNNIEGKNHLLNIGQSSTTPGKVGTEDAGSYGFCFWGLSNAASNKITQGCSDLGWFTVPNTITTVTGTNYKFTDSNSQNPSTSVVNTTLPAGTYSIPSVQISNWFGGSGKGPLLIVCTKHSVTNATTLNECYTLNFWVSANGPISNTTTYFQGNSPDKTTFTVYGPVSFIAQNPPGDPNPTITSINVQSIK